MKKISKLLLFTVLAIALSALFAVSVFAADGEEATVPEGSVIMHTATDGTVTYYTADDFATAITKGGTVKLLNDVYTECATISVAKDIVLDLNGYELRRVTYYGNYYVASLDSETGALSYPKDTTYATATDKSTYATLFNVTKDSIDITVTSTAAAGGGALYIANLEADTWYYEGTVVKRECTGNVGLSRLIYNTSSKNATFTANNGISLYLETIYYQSYANQLTHTVTIDNVNYYGMKNTDIAQTYCFYFGSKGNVTVNVSNSLFYFNSLYYYNSSGVQKTSYFFRFYTATADGCTAKATFTNCDIIKPDDSSLASIANSKTADALVFDNCRLFDIGRNNTAAYITEGTLSYSSSNSYVMPAPEGCEVQTVSDVTKAYKVPSAITFAYDSSEDINTAVLSYELIDYTVTYNRIVSKPVTVNWYNPDGSVNTTETLYPGASALSAPELEPYYDETNDYVDIAYQWADAAENGKAIPEILGWDSENQIPLVSEWVSTYDFYPVTEIDGVKNYVKGLKDVRISLSYVSQLWIHLYLPVQEGMERPTVSGSDTKDGGTDLIDGKEYYVYTYYLSTTTALDNKTRTATYTVGETTYKVNLTFSALIYAEQVFASEGYTEELESVANLLRYIREAYEITAETDTDTAATLETYSERVTALIGTANADGSTSGGEYSLPKYTTEFDVPESNIYDYSEYIYSVTYGMRGASARTIIMLTPEATDASVTVTKITTGGINPGLKDGTATIVIDDAGTTATVNRYYGNNQRIYDAIGILKITLSIPAHTLEDGTEVAASTATVTYSMAEYITAMTENYPDENIDVARAMYDFGVAAKNYRDNLTDY